MNQILDLTDALEQIKTPNLYLRPYRTEDFIFVCFRK